MCVPERAGSGDASSGPVVVVLDLVGVIRKQTESCYSPTRPDIRVGQKKRGNVRTLPRITTTVVVGRRAAAASVVAPHPPGGVVCVKRPALGVPPESFPFESGSRNNCSSNFLLLQKTIPLAVRVRAGQANICGRKEGGIQHHHRPPAPARHDDDPPLEDGKEVKVDSGNAKLLPLNKEKTQTWENKSLQF